MSYHHLHEVRKAISEAKSHLFRAQDVAGEIEDAELLNELRKARWALEAADRRQGDLRLRIGRPHSID